MSLRRLMRRIRGEESGAAVVMVALSLTLLLLFVAVAIDAAGLGYNERRQDQSAADVAALTAVQYTSSSFGLDSACTGFTGLARSRCNGAAEAMKVANATLDDPSLADWSDATLCPDRPSGFTASPITPCVAFNVNNQRAWVRIPFIEKPTSIARAVGFDSITTSASAIAGTSILSPGGVLPFLLPGNAAGADYNCLKASSNPNFGPCADLPSVGNFGAMDFYLYGNLDLNYTERCTGDTNGRFTANVSRGIDHPLGKHPTGNGSGRLDQAHCPDFNAAPDMVFAQTGNISIEQGFLYGGSDYSSVAYPGRIQTPPSASGSILVRGPQGSTAAAWIDNVPLWSYLKTFSGGHPCSGVSTPAAMEACIVWAKSTGTEIFTNDLVDSIRFGFTPAVWETDFSQGTSTAYHIKGFHPVYLDTTFFGCNNNGCSIMHTPGVAVSGACVVSPPQDYDSRVTCGDPFPGTGNKGLEAIAAYILSPEIVPANAKSPMPGDPNQLTYNLID